jgi:hypothetical protein
MQIKGFCIKINKNDPEYIINNGYDHCKVKSNYIEIKKKDTELAFNFAFLASEYEIDSFNGIEYMYIYSNSIHDLQNLINYIEDVYEKKLTYTFIDEECE